MGWNYMVGVRDPFGAVLSEEVVTEIDTVGPWPVFIDVAHHQIHEGDASTAIHTAATLNDGGVASVYISCPSGSYPHLLWHATCPQAFTVEFFSSATISDSGTLLDKVCRNLNKTDKTYATFHASATITDSGTLREMFYIGGGAQRSGGDNRGTNEWVLQAENSYLLRLTSRANGNSAAIVLDYYEEGAYAR